MSIPSSKWNLPRSIHKMESVIPKHHSTMTGTIFMDSGYICCTSSHPAEPSATKCFAVNLPVSRNVNVLLRFRRAYVRLNCIFWTCTPLLIMVQRKTIANISTWTNDGSLMMLSKLLCIKPLQSSCEISNIRRPRKFIRCSRKVSND